MHTITNTFCICIYIIVCECSVMHEKTLLCLSLANQDMMPHGNSPDQEKTKLIQQQLVILLHANKCLQKERESDIPHHCNLPHCHVMKGVLQHMTSCMRQRDCPCEFTDTLVDLLHVHTYIADIQENGY